MALPEFDFCVGPLVHTDTKNEINWDAEPFPVGPIEVAPGVNIYVDGTLEKCGLSCRAGSAIYGMSDAEQELVDLFKIVGCSICFVCVVYLAVNLWLDKKASGKKWSEKPLLQVIPYVLTFSLFCMVFLMTVGLMSGKDAILCTSHPYDKEAFPDEDPLEFTAYNPKYGKSAACTIHGVLFYSSVLSINFYTLLLCFVIFRFFYNPMNPLWRINQRWWHLIVFLVIVLFDSIALGLNSFGGIRPMGVCFPGTGSSKELRGLLCVPMTLCTGLSFLLLCVSGFILHRKVSQNKAKDGNKGKVQKPGGGDKVQELLTRLIWYGICAVAGLTLLTATAWNFWDTGPKLGRTMLATIMCELEQIVLGQNTDVDCQALRTYSSHPFWFISWVIAAVLCCVAQIILSCNQETRQRFKKASQYATSKMVSSQRL